MTQKVVGLLIKPTVSCDVSKWGLIKIAGTIMYEAGQAVITAYMHVYHYQNSHILYVELSLVCC